MAKEKTDKVRLTLDLSGSLNAQLDSIAQETGKTKAELMRLALDFLLRADEAQKDDMTVGAWKNDEENHLRIERQFLGLG